MQEMISRILFLRLCGFCCALRVVLCLIAACKGGNRYISTIVYHNGRLVDALVVQVVCTDAKVTALSPRSPWLHASWISGFSFAVSRVWACRSLFCSFACWIFRCQMTDCRAISVAVIFGCSGSELGRQCHADAHSSHAVCTNGRRL